MRISIASTFTCNPIENALRFWIEKFGFKAALNFSPYDQVFQELLDLDSTLNHPENDARILFVRFEDWIRNLSKKEVTDFHSHIVQNIHSLSEYAAIAAESRKDPLILNIGHNSKGSVISHKTQRVYEQILQQKLSDQSNIYVLTSDEIENNYPVENYDDPQRDLLGHIPFTDEYFTALATSVFRRVLAVKRKPYKVIVLDCDNTLWGGACGELGVNGIDLSNPFLTLQKFMRDQVEAGKIICLCSKNVEEDVNQVFTERADMILRKEHIVSVKINWQPKSQNIKELAEELNLGLDSFIFVDDNPVECAEVRANCPEVLTFNLPEKPEQIASFLNHVWAFDTIQLTREDQERTKLYQENIQRSTFQKSISSLKDFIDGLNLEIIIKTPSPEDISRVSQLTYRTNQFNFTTLRRSEEEVKELIQKDGFECKACRVKDRFGDYGLVGVMLYQKVSGQIVLDSFMLSCRVLGRGVEHKMLKFIGEAAKSEGVNTIQINFNKTEKNLPALNFLESIIKNFPGGVFFDENGYSFPSNYLSELRYDPDKNIAEKTAVNDHSIKSESKEPEEDSHQIFEQIAKEWNSVCNIHQVLNSKKGDPGSQISFNGKKDTLQTITGIWENILGITGVGPDKHFFDVGGTSLKAVEVLSQLNKEFQKNFTIVSLFEHSTIRSLAELVDGKPAEKSEFNKILERAGARRDRVRRKN